MHPIIYYILVYLVISAIGMYVANRKVSVEIQQQRWLKFFTYILIVAIIMASIFFTRFFWIVLFILAACIFELFRANYFIAQKSFEYFIIVFLFFAVVAFGFFSFAKSFTPSAQLFIYFQVFTFDAFCQVTGQLFGKKLLSKKISPSKTVEGLIGGIIFCILSAMLAAAWVNLSVYIAAMIGAVTAFTAFCGDMLASYFKRVIHIKDYSNFLPGQGGFLDRFDSLIMTGAFYYFFLHFFFKDQPYTSLRWLN
jgi:phosphatidate cytidylyltransferase